MSGKTISSTATDAAGALAFGRARRQCCWVRIDEGAPAPASGDAYVTLVLLDQVLARRRLFSSRFLPIVMARFEFPQSPFEPILQTAVVERQEKLNGKTIRNSDGFIPPDNVLCSQAPWQGNHKASLQLLAVRSEEILDRILSLKTDIEGALAKNRKSGNDEFSDEADADEGFSGSPGAGESTNESLLAVAGSLAIGAAIKAFEARVTYDIAAAVARTVLKGHGDVSKRLEGPNLPADLAPGKYVLWQLNRGHEALPAFRFDAPSKTLYADGKPVSGRDYAVIEVTTSRRHENIQSIPKVAAAFSLLNEVITAGGNPADALARLKREVAISPYLIDSDRRDLARRFDLHVANAFRDTGPADAGHAGAQEGVFDDAVRAAPRLFRSLKQLWYARTSDLDGPGAPAPPPPATPPPAEPVKPDAPAAAPISFPADPAGGSQRFNRSLRFALKWEGGFSDVKDDPGGRTNRGITERVYHEWLNARGDDPVPVEHITEEEVRAIYYSEYWLTACCNVLSPQTDWIVFDAAVNHGPAGSLRLLQRALNKLGASLEVDGKFGPRTAAAGARAAPGDLRPALLSERRELYHRIVKARPTQEKFLKGWLNRVASLESETGAEGLESLGTGQPEPENTAFAEYVD